MPRDGASPCRGESCAVACPLDGSTMWTTPSRSRTTAFPSVPTAAAATSAPAPSKALCRSQSPSRVQNRAASRAAVTTRRSRASRVAIEVPGACAAATSERVPVAASTATSRGARGWQTAHATRSPTHASAVARASSVATRSNRFRAASTTTSAPRSSPAATRAPASTATAVKRTRESAEAGRFCNTHTTPSTVGRGARPGGHRLPEQGCLPPGTEVVEAIRGWLLSFWYRRQGSPTLVVPPLALFCTSQNSDRIERTEFEINVLNGFCGDF